VTYAQRFSHIANRPTTSEEAVPEFDPKTWCCLHTRLCIPPAIVDSMHKAFSAARKNAAVEEKLGQLGVVLRMTSRAVLEVSRKRCDAREKGGQGEQEPTTVMPQRNSRSLSARAQCGAYY